MGFWGSLLATPKAATPTVEAAFNDVFSIAPFLDTTANNPFIAPTSATRADAMSIPTISRAVGIMQTIASLPMHTRNIGSGEKVEQPRVINQPDKRIPGATFWGWLISDLFFHSTGYAYVVDRYKENGRIREMERIAPERVTIYTSFKFSKIFRAAFG